MSCTVRIPFLTYTAFWETLENSTNPGKSTSETYYLFIRMKENVGNDFKDQIFTGIGVTVFATQRNVSIEEAEGGK